MQSTHGLEAYLMNTYPDIRYTYLPSSQYTGLCRCGMPCTNVAWSCVKHFTIDLLCNNSISEMKLGHSPLLQSFDLQEPDQLFAKFHLTTLQATLREAWEGPVCCVAVFPKNFCPMAASLSMNSRQLKAMGIVYLSCVSLPQIFVFGSSALFL